jgi:hypothetical protein
MMKGDSITSRDEAILAFTEQGWPGERLKGVKEQMLRELKIGDVQLQTVVSLDHLNFRILNFELSTIPRGSIS